MDALLAEVRMNKIKGTGQNNQAGLGYGVRAKPKRELEREREEMLEVFSEIEEQNRIVRALTKRKYCSDWLKWDSSMAVDVSWQQLLHKHSDSHLKFLLNAIECELPTPSNLARWNQGSACGGKCPLGCGQVGSLMHTLYSCKRAHNEEPQNRIAWRHDSILLAIYHAGHRSHIGSQSDDLEAHG